MEHLCSRPVPGATCHLDAEHMGPPWALWPSWVDKVTPQAKGRTGASLKGTWRREDIAVLGMVRRPLEGASVFGVDGQIGLQHVDGARG